MAHYSDRDPVLTVTTPTGKVIEDLRPGHSLAGLLPLMDPFYRKARVQLSSVGYHVGAYYRGLAYA